MGYENTVSIGGGLIWRRSQHPIQREIWAGMILDMLSMGSVSVRLLFFAVRGDSVVDFMQAVNCIAVDDLQNTNNIHKTKGTFRGLSPNYKYWGSSDSNPSPTCYASKKNNVY